MLGTSINHYKILEKIGEGSMGEVYRAEDTNLDREVAIKVLPDQFTQDSCQPPFRPLGRIAPISSSCR